MVFGQTQTVLLLCNKIPLLSSVCKKIYPIKKAKPENTNLTIYSAWITTVYCKLRAVLSLRANAVCVAISPPLTQGKVVLAFGHRSRGTYALTHLGPTKRYQRFA